MPTASRRWPLAAAAGLLLWLARENLRGPSPTRPSVTPSRSLDAAAAAPGRPRASAEPPQRAERSAARVAGCCAWSET